MKEEELKQQVVELNALNALDVGKLNVVSDAPVRVPREEASNVFGWLSIGCWLIVYSPQIYENYRDQSGEGLSVIFVVTWLLGDLFNLFGGIMAGLLPTVILLALYYTLCDVILLLQIYYYRIFKSSATRPIGEAETTPLLESQTTANGHLKTSSSSLARDALKYTLLCLFVLSFGLGAYFYNKAKREHSEPGEEAPAGDVFEWKSQVMGWASALLYLGSRIPQIMKNNQTRCHGLSLALFLFAILGNLFYVLSICVVSMSPEHILTNSSWLAGSGLTIFFDLFVLSQFFYFRYEDRKLAEREVFARIAGE